MQKRRSKQRRSKQRRGTATVEFAIFLPALIALTLGTIDVCSIMYLKESATLAAYEGARQGIGRGHTNGNCEARVFDFLNERGIVYDTSDVVTISTPGFDNAVALENVTVTVTIPCADNLLITSAFFNGANVTAAVTMRKEYKNLELPAP